VKDRVGVAVVVKIDPACTACILLRIAKRNIVVDRVVVGAVDEPDPIRSIVIRGVPADGGISRTVKVNPRALLILTINELWMC
jgi:hypothetical protein